MGKVSFLVHKCQFFKNTHFPVWIFMILYIFLMDLNDFIRGLDGFRVTLRSLRRHIGVTLGL